MSNQKNKQSQVSRREALHALELERRQDKLAEIRPIVEKMLRLDELFRLAQNGDSQFNEFLSQNEEHRKTVESFSAKLQKLFTSAETGNPSAEKDVFLHALKYMVATKGFSMVAYLYRPDDSFVKFLKRNISQLIPVMDAFQGYKQSKKAVNQNTNHVETKTAKRAAKLQNFISNDNCEPDLTESYLNFSSKYDIFAPSYVAYNKYGQRITEFAMDQSLLSLEPEVDLTKSVISVPRVIF